MAFLWAFLRALNGLFGGAPEGVSSRRVFLHVVLSVLGIQVSSAGVPEGFPAGVKRVGGVPEGVKISPRVVGVVLRVAPRVFPWVVLRACEIQGSATGVPAGLPAVDRPRPWQLHAHTEGHTF